jgi:hypothetical protein
LTRVENTIGRWLSAARSVVDAARRVARFLHGVDEGQADLAEAHLELAQHRVAEGLGGDAGTVGNEENTVRAAFGFFGRASTVMVPFC